jgi:malate/lactate dehydrogenase
MQSNWKSRKVVIVGAGAVSSTFVYALAQKGLAEEKEAFIPGLTLIAGFIEHAI